MFSRIYDLSRGTVAAAFVAAALSLPAFGAGSSTSIRPKAPARTALAHRVQHSAPTSCLITACIYVLNEASPSVTVYPASAKGNVSPVQAITGSNTGLVQPSGGLAVDADRNIYATDAWYFFGHPRFDVFVYAAGSTGDVSPIRDIAGSSTGLDWPAGIALGSDGSVFVANRSTGSGGSVTVYQPGATGNVTPTATVIGSDTGLNGPTGIAVGPNGGIFVANIRNSVTIYLPGANGNVRPIQTISGPNTGLNSPSGIALGANGAIFVTSTGSNSVLVYAPTANGNVAPLYTIRGSNTLLRSPFGIALGAHGGVFVTDPPCIPSSCSGGSVTAYSPGVFGNVAPIKLIRGSLTGLEGPSGIAIR